MKVMVTGSTGTIGASLTKKLIAQGHQVWGLSRTWDTNYDPVPDNFWHITGDITLENLGLSSYWKVDAVYHLAGLVNLSPVDRDGLIHKTNVVGTQNVVNFCERNQVPHLYYCSTAYADGNRNPYENSKRAAEIIIRHSTIPEVTIFKPSLVLGCDKQHFSQFVSLLILFHRRAEIVRRKIEGTLRLPVLEPCFRINGDASAPLNLITLDAVTTAMATIKESGTFWLTNPKPPTLTELAKIVGDFCMINLSFSEKFTATPIEIAFQRMIKTFSPYLQKDAEDFSSDLSDFKLTPQDIENELIKLIH